MNPEADRVERYRRRLERFMNEAEAEAKLFDLREILSESSRLKEKHVEGLGLVRYGPLTIADLAELSEVKGDLEKGVMAIYLMLKKADEKIKLEDLKNLPVDVALRLLNALAPEVRASFLQGKTLKG